MLFTEIIKKEFQEWNENGNIEEALKLNEKVGSEYFDVKNPHFFTGDLNSPLVLVHLNPKRSKDFYNHLNTFNNYNDYLNNYLHFGTNKYGPLSKRDHKSPFDHKQIRFLKPLGILPFKEGDKYHNLVTVIDNKLQIELVPYGSPEFNFAKIGTENLIPFVDRILVHLLAQKRDYIIFCGKVFIPLLQPYIIQEKVHSFKLLKKDGKSTVHDFHVISIKLKYDDKDITAVIAPQFAKQGYPVSQYGEMIKKYYGIF
ncbi:MAG: hypothetical protein KA270_01000 [Saprospiraceae bacterium]|nr:hypothetical protein [Saprospiraceae bacterium]MBP6565707.1 hypothetical protein [Saprospiraceae bacterium]